MKIEIILLLLLLFFVSVVAKNTIIGKFTLHSKPESLSLFDDGLLSSLLPDDGGILLFVVSSVDVIYAKFLRQKQQYESLKR